MAKKKKDKKTQDRKDAAEKLARDVAKSAHQIWLAGLGMFDSAREEGGKLFDKMVKRGEQLEAHAKPKVTQAAQDVKQAVKKEMRRIEAQLKVMVNKIDTWRSSPTPAPQPASKKKPAVKKKAAPRKRAAAKKKAAPKRKAAPRKKAAAKKKAAPRKAAPRKCAPKKVARRRAPANKRNTPRKS